MEENMRFFQEALLGFDVLHLCSLSGKVLWSKDQYRIT
jgi:hypothetical protein